MAKGVFIHNPGTHYDDDPATRYHFPKRYLDRVKPIVGDNVLFYQSGKTAESDWPHPKYMAWHRNHHSFEEA